VVCRGAFVVVSVPNRSFADAFWRAQVVMQRWFWTTVVLIGPSSFAVSCMRNGSSVGDELRSRKTTFPVAN